MSLIFTLFNEVPFFLLPSDWIGWLGLGIWVIVIGICLWHWRGYNKKLDQAKWLILGGLIIITPLTSLVLGIRLPAWNLYPPPGITIEPVGPALMFFSALPWILAAGVLGPAPAAGVAALSGLIMAYWDTHSIFTPFEMAFLAILFSAAVSQRFRTRVYSWLRNPSIASVTILLIYPIVYVLGVVFVIQGAFASRIDYAVLQVPMVWLALGGSMLIAGILAEFVRILSPRLWGGQPPWIPSPAESGLESRLIFSMAPLAIALILTLMIADWMAAGDAARQMIEERMASASSLAAHEVPFFLDTGQNLILQFSKDDRLLDESATPEELAEVLHQMLGSAPYFRQLFLLDNSGSSIAGYPQTIYDDDFAPLEEKSGIDLALNGVLIQVYTIPPSDDDASARVSYIAAIEEDGIQRVLLGRTDLYSNPFSQPILSSLNSLSDIDGGGFLLDEENRVLYHPDPNQLWLVYPSTEQTEPGMFDDTAADGTRQLVYYQPAVGRPWIIMMTVPAQSAQQLAIGIATPLLIMIVVVALLALILMHFGLKMVTSSLDKLAIQANKIAQGDLDQPLSVYGDDEVAQLSRSFEQMRVRLKARLQELNQLLVVSQGVASSLEMDEAVLPILESALTLGGVAARVILVPTVLPDFKGSDNKPSRFSSGPDADHYAYLDEQILLMMRNEDEVVIPNTNRSSMLSFIAGVPRPDAVIAVSLRHESLYYGVLWIAHKRPHNFSSEERRFINTLAGQAALAASNAHLFMTAEIGRQRLAAILASTPDPVLVTDHRDCLLLLNPAALLLFEMQTQTGIGKPIAEILDQTELIDLMRVATTEEEFVEVTLENERIYLATASSIVADEQSVGRVCILRDITYFKELDALKTEFVATVSHDLRSPLTLMRGYATMLEMVGDLNTQQEGYVQKIVVGVESMSRLVNNLLDLGRIEANVGLRLEMLSVHDIVEQVTEALNLQAAQKQIQMHISVPEGAVPLIEADQALLTQALQNLVENAIKYTPPNGEVWLSTNIRQDCILFEVRDTGIGVSPVDQPRLFEKFYRSANREAKRERGTGLGLAIVKSIAERHGGQVGMQSQLGSGSTFFISIPIRQPI